MMAKGFSEHEREIINEKLFESCEECWKQYGYRKTTVEEICRRSGISTGAFYLFYPSKEHLFAETSHKVAGRLVAIVENDIPPEPTKYDFGKALKRLIKELETLPWFLTVTDDLEMISRKLPADYFEKTGILELGTFSDLIKKYGLVPTVKINPMAAVLRSLTAMTHIRKIAGIAQDFDAAYEFIIDSTIEKLFK
jgi:AcrR family transcriptional regulator